MPVNMLSEEEFKAKQDEILTQLDITLSSLRDAITASGVNAKTLNDLYGLLATIDDLQAALASVATDQLRVDVISSALPSGAATAANQATIISEIEQFSNGTGIQHGKETVTTAGTAEALNGGVSLAVPDGVGVVVKALAGNTDLVYVGGSTVSSVNGLELSAGESVTLYVNDVSLIYIDVAVSGEGVTWIFESGGGYA